MEQPPILDYRPIQPRARLGARLVRGGMLALAIIAIHVAAILVFNPVWPGVEALGGGAIGTPASPIDASLDNDEKQSQYIPRAAGYFAVFLLSQWFFLMPRGSWRITVANDEPLPKRNAIAAGLIGMLVSIGLLATLMEIPDWWLKLTTEKGLNSTQHYGVVWVVMLIVWATWSIVFYSYWRSLDRYTGMRRVFRWLLAGTIVELVIAAPAHAWIIKDRGGECYCQRGTWTGLAFGGTAALWLFGPGAFLLFMREKKRREGLI